LAGLSILLVLAAGSQAQQPPRIEPLGALDRSFMQQQRSRIDDLARIKLGRQLRGEREHDLQLLQDLLDRRWVRADQKTELQAMGVVLGDLLAEDLGMRWVVYEDAVGRSRALRLEQTDNYLFPMTMISRRVEAGASVSVEVVYRKASEMIEPYRTPLPFQ
jgi:hypothetical protein